MGKVWLGGGWLAGYWKNLPLIQCGGFQDGCHVVDIHPPHTYTHYLLGYSDMSSSFFYLK